MKRTKTFNTLLINTFAKIIFALTTIAWAGTMPPHERTRHPRRGLHRLRPGPTVPADPRCHVGTHGEGTGRRRP